MPALRDQVEDVDLDLHGHVRIRVLQPADGDVARVERSLGPLQAPSGGIPDITVRFVDRLHLDGPVVYTGWPDAGRTDDSFVLLSGRGGVEARTVVDLRQVGRGCAVVCERTNRSVPHLLALVNFAALAKGVLPLHASAFAHEGKGVLVTGWSKGGKSETLLAFAQNGARPVGDEWVYLTPDGEMSGVPEPMRLWLWQLRQLPAVWSRLPVASRARLTALDRARGVLAVTGRGGGSTSARARRLLERQLYVQVPPVELFGTASVATAAMDDVVLVESHSSEEVVTGSISGEELAARMAASLEEERAPFMAVYRQFRFAFPDRSSEVVETAVERERELLEKVFAGRRVGVLRHPYPVPIRSLYSPVRALLG